MKRPFNIGIDHLRKVGISLLLVTIAAFGLADAAEELDPITKIASEKRGALVVAEI